VAALLLEHPEGVWEATEALHQGLGEEHTRTLRTTWATCNDHWSIMLVISSVLITITGPPDDRSPALSTSP
jgi:hypothetical protein